MTYFLGMGGIGHCHYLGMGMLGVLTPQYGQLQLWGQQVPKQKQVRQWHCNWLCRQVMSLPLLSQVAFTRSQTSRGRPYRIYTDRVCAAKEEKVGEEMAGGSFSPYCRRYYMGWMREPNPATPLSSIWSHTWACRPEGAQVLLAGPGDGPTSSSMSMAKRTYFCDSQLLFMYPPVDVWLLALQCYTISCHVWIQHCNSYHFLILLYIFVCLFFGSSLSVLMAP